jgi:hypothetical protein
MTPAEPEPTVDTNYDQWAVVSVEDDHHVESFAIVFANMAESKVVGATGALTQGQLRDALRRYDLATTEPEVHDLIQLAREYRRGQSTEPVSAIDIFS